MHSLTLAPAPREQESTRRSGKYLAVRGRLDEERSALALIERLSVALNDERRSPRGVADAAVRAFLAYGLPCAIDLVDEMGARERRGATRDAVVDAQIDSCAERAIASGQPVVDWAADVDGLEWVTSVPLGRGALTVWARAWPAPPPVALFQAVAGIVDHAATCARDAASAREAVLRREGAMASIAHDLKNALTVVLAASQQIRADLCAATDARFGVPAVERQARSMLALVRDVLDAAAFDSHEIALDCAAVAPAELVRRAITNVAPLAATRSIRLRCEVASALPDVRGDEPRLLRVLGNLLGNALKFTPRGSSVVAGATRHPSGVAFFVRDSGPGVPAADREAVFERFWRGSSDYGGSGLGLAISRELVRAHGGDIWVDPRTRRGARFVFTLPTME